jgi:hypothetical protein
MYANGLQDDASCGIRMHAFSRIIYGESDEFGALRTPLAD